MLHKHTQALLHAQAVTDIFTLWLWRRNAKMYNEAVDRDFQAQGNNQVEYDEAKLETITSSKFWN